MPAYSHYRRPEVAYYDLKIPPRIWRDWTVGQHDFIWEFFRAGVEGETEQMTATLIVWSIAGPRRDPGFRLFDFRVDGVPVDYDHVQVELVS